jgi:CRISPR-associated protein Csb2
MTILELRFPAGRYHATPWGRHVNEGAVEWPPSPWRLVRALIATWYLKAREIPEETIRSLVNVLSQPPSFQLPSATTSHTRHYMPFNEGKNEKTTKIFDTFIQLPDGAVVLVMWDVSLSATELETLETLASRLGYLGRAESLVTVRVLEDRAEFKANASPLAEGAELPPRHEIVRLLCPMAPTDYEEWRENFVAKFETPPNGKKKSSKINKEPEVPTDLFAALHADTGELQSAGWNLPPGAKFVNYARPENAFAPASKPRVRRHRELPTVARYSVVSVVPPQITQTISVAHRVHQSLCSEKLSGQKISPKVFSGMGDDGESLVGHGHAHIFCEANDPEGSLAITHIIVWAPMGFDKDSCLALRRLNKVWGYGGHDIRLVLHSLGRPEDFKDCSLFKASRCWHSLTPFVSTRHAKHFRDGRPKIDPVNGWPIASAGHDLLRLLPESPRTVTAGGKIRQNKVLSINGRILRSLQFQLIRKGGGGSRGDMNGGAFEIEFEHMVTGPLTFGYGAHFGLGLFAPMPPV